MRKHLTLVAALQIGFSSIGLIGSIILYFVFSFAGTVVGNDDIASTVIHFIGTFLPTSLLLISLLGFVGGIGLLTFQRWAKVLVIILAAIGCFFIPIGTIIGVYSLWVLLQDETDTLFH